MNLVAWEIVADLRHIMSVICNYLNLIEKIRRYYTTNIEIQQKSGFIIVFKGICLNVVAL
jgi:hypothetical protein